MKGKTRPRYVVYDQHHWNDPDHLERPVTGTRKEIIGQYRFYRDCFPDKSLGLATIEEYRRIRQSYTDKTPP